MNLAFTPAHFGIARHFGRTAVVRAQKNPQQQTASLVVPWTPGSMENGARAVHTAKTALEETYRQPFPVSLATFQPPHQSQTFKVFVLGLRGDLPRFDLSSPNIFWHRGNPFLNPTPHRFRPDQIRGVSPAVDFSSFDPNVIFLTNWQQPLSYPATGRGFFIHFVADWNSEGIYPNSQAVLRIVLGGSVVNEFRMTGGELSLTLRISATDHEQVAHHLYKMAEDPEPLLEQKSVVSSGPVIRETIMRFGGDLLPFLGPLCRVFAKSAIELHRLSLH